MSSILTSSLVISLALVSVIWGVWARFRPRVTFRRSSQQIGHTHVFDGAVDVTTRDEAQTSFSGYVCYIRRAREKTVQLPTVSP
ncbi:MAG: hypothetical protein HZY79_09840 [Rhodoblastus sp.]|nr:MAG: hypothetical protein HZY79_09840 [Rhodoblastus sp.]